MAAKRMRNIVKIDESKCDGCGACIVSCAEGAIAIIDGKARLVGENLCDGLGNCLGRCPRDAITVEQRAADDFDEQAVQRHLAVAPAAAVAPPVGHAHGGCPGAAMQLLGFGAAPAGGCPGTMARQLKAPRQAVTEGPGTAESQLTHWPVQLALVPTTGPIWQEADVLIAADCVSFAMADFHQRLLAGRTLAIACPKLDDVEPYIVKLAAIFAHNTIRSVTVAHMEVPCCMGLVFAVKDALAKSGRTDLPLREVTISVEGRIKSDSDAAEAGRS